MRSKKVQKLAVPTIDISKFSVTDTDGFLQHGLKYRLKVAGISTDYLKHLRSGGLLFEGSARSVVRPVRSIVRWRSSFSSRVFSIAMTAWAAKFSTNSIWLSVYGCTFDRVRVDADRFPLPQ